MEGALYGRDFERLIHGEWRPGLTGHRPRRRPRAFTYAEFRIANRMPGGDVPDVWMFDGVHERREVLAARG